VEGWCLVLDVGGSGEGEVKWEWGWAERARGGSGAVRCGAVRC
jgi:hypothetical protein